MTVFETHFAAAGTGLIWLCFGEGSREMRFSFSHDRHHIGGRATSAHQHGEDLVRFVDAVEKTFVSCAQVIEAGLSSGGLDKSILGTFPVTGETHVTVQAVLGQRIAFIQPKLDLLVRSDQFEHVLLLDITEQIIGFHEMVAGVQVTIVLYG